MIEWARIHCEATCARTNRSQWFFGAAKQLRDRSRIPTLERNFGLMICCTFSNDALNENIPFSHRVCIEFQQIKLKCNMFVIQKSVAKRILIIYCIITIQLCGIGTIFRPTDTIAVQQFIIIIYVNLNEAKYANYLIDTEQRRCARDRTFNWLRRFNWICISISVNLLFISIAVHISARQTASNWKNFGVAIASYVCILMHNFLMAARKKILWVCFFSVCLFAARRSQGEPSTVTTHSFVFFPSNHSCHFECRLQCEWLIFFAACLCVVHTQFSD